MSASCTYPQSQLHLQDEKLPGSQISLIVGLGLSLFGAIGEVPAVDVKQELVSDCSELLSGAHVTGRDLGDPWECHH